MSRISGALASGLKAFGYVPSAAGRLVTEKNTIAKAAAAGAGSWVRWLSSEYDAAGNKVKATRPNSLFATYTYDALNRMIEVDTYGLYDFMFYTYDALSRRTDV